MGLGITAAVLLLEIEESTFGVSHVIEPTGFDGAFEDMGGYPETGLGPAELGAPALFSVLAWAPSAFKLLFATSVP